MRDNIANLLPRLSNVSDDLLFHYTGVSAAIERILYEGKVRFGRLENTNDRFESAIWDFQVGYWGHKDNCVEQFTSIQRLTEAVHNKCRVFCTTTDDSNPNFDYRRYSVNQGFAIPSLWAHYGDSHKGICIAFDKNRLIRAARKFAADQFFYCCEISYDGPPKPTDPAFDFDLSGIEVDQTNGFFYNHLTEYVRSILFKKDAAWHAEREFRLATILNKNENDFEIDIHDSLVGIITGELFHESYKPVILDIGRRLKIETAFLEWETGRPRLYPWG